MRRLDDVCRDDVVPRVREQQVIAPVVEPQPHVRLPKHVLVDVREPLRRSDDAGRELDDVEGEIGMQAHRAARRAAAEADDERTPRRRVKQQRQMTDLPVQEHDVAPVAGLVQAVEIQQPAAELAHVHADRRLHAFVAHEDVS